MRVIFMGRKPSASEALRYLVTRGVDVALVVAPPADKPVHWRPRLADTASSYGIPIASDEELYACLAEQGDEFRGVSLRDVDLVISFLFWKKIKRPLIDLPRIGCINFHPAPLPEFRGVGGYNFAIYEGMRYWGVSAHFVDESFDTGDIIKVRRFEIDPAKETAFSLEQKSQRYLLDLFQEVIEELYEKGDLPRIPQGKGRYISREDFERLRRIGQDDSPEEIKKKIRAFWYPPYMGASIEIGGEEFTLVSREILEELGRMYHRWEALGKLEDD